MCVEHCFLVYAGHKRIDNPDIQNKMLYVSCGYGRKQKSTYQASASGWSLKPCQISANRFYESARIQKWRQQSILLLNLSRIRNLNKTIDYLHLIYSFLLHLKQKQP